MADRVPRGPTGVPILGSSLDLATDPLGFFEECAAEYGDCVRVEGLDGELYLLTDPAGIERVLAGNHRNYRKPDFGERGLDGLLGEGLLTSDGDEWLAQRRRIQPAFDREMLDRYADAMVADARELAAGWADRDRVDVDAAMSELTLRIIVETVLGTELGGMEREIADALEDVGRRFRSDDPQVLVPPAVPTPRNLRYRRGERRLDRVVRELIRQRERDLGDREGGDMLAILLRARETGAVSDERLRDQVLTMLLAGHDTTALTLTYAWYLLSEHPEVRERFHAEVDALDGDPTAGDELAYTERIVKEALRLYPPVYTIYREAVGDDSVAGFRVPEGAVVGTPQWVVHRDQRWYDDPEAFRPERWEGESDRPGYAFFPFGGGPRRCIGEAFAMREAALVLATLGRRYALDYVGDGLDLVPVVTLHPEPPVEFELRAR